MANSSGLCMHLDSFEKTVLNITKCQCTLVCFFYKQPGTNRGYDEKCLSKRLARYVANAAHVPEQYAISVFVQKFDYL